MIIIVKLALYYSKVCVYVQLSLEGLKHMTRTTICKKLLSYKLQNDLFY